MPPPTAVPSSRTQSTSGGSNNAHDEDELRPYVLAGELGHGSFATVYRGFNETSKEQVAIKTFSRSNLSARLFDNLQSEIEILKSLSHRHITKLIDIVRAEKNIYLIMEFCSGGDLTNYIKKRGKVETLEYIPSPGAAPIYYPHPKSGGLDEVVVRSFLRQLARALRFLRQRNLIHRDIKPQNLLLKPALPEELARGHPLGVPILKVADFGFARSLPNAMMAETLCGSPLYMAPEILRYEKYDAKADLWSVGAVLYETAVGRAPFRAVNHIELLKKIDRSKDVRFPDEDPAVLEKDPTMKPVPADIKKLIRSLLKRFPAERASFEEFFNSTALANSKHPRPRQAKGHTGTSLDALSPSSSRTTSTAFGDGEAVVIGAVKRRSRQATTDPSYPESSRPAPPPPSDNSKGMAPRDSPDSRAVTQPKFSSRHRRESGDERFPDPSGPAAVTEATTVAASGAAGTSGADSPGNRSSGRPLDVAADVDVGGEPGTRRRPSTDLSALGRPLSTEASIIPGETEEDGFLRREYVMVGDTRAIEFNKTVDEIAAARRRQPTERKLSHSPATERRQSGLFRQTTDSPPSLGPSSGPGVGGGNDAATPVPIAFPPPPNLHAPPASVSPQRGSALTRALSIASKKLLGTLSPASAGFGVGSAPNGGRVGSNGPSYFPDREWPAMRGDEAQRSPRRAPLLLPADGEGPIQDPLEEDLLVGLEDLAQKTAALTRWADDMYEYVKAVPQKPLISVAQFAPISGESEAATQRRQTAVVEAEYNAVTCVALYLLLMSFSQKGIDRLRVHQEGMKMRDPEGRLEVSEGFDDALTWFSNHFMKCSDRASLVKTWLPEKTMEGPPWLGQIVYDRALQLSRKAAQMELVDQDARSPQDCIAMYEESLWCLYALQDELMQAGNPFRDEDKVTIETWIEKTKKRLTACKAKQAILGDGRKKPFSALTLAKQRSLGMGVDNGTVLTPLVSNANDYGLQTRSSPGEVLASPSPRR